MKKKFFIICTIEILFSFYVCHLAEKYKLQDVPNLCISVGIVLLLGNTAFYLMGKKKKKETNISIFWDKYNLANCREGETTDELKKLALNWDIPEEDRLIALALFDLYNKANKFI